MRESMIRELYYGNVSPWERRRVYSPERIALADKIDDIVQHFKNLLSPEEYKKFAEMQELESPTLAASFIGITSKPSITASIALIGSISVTITRAPRPFARIAVPLPHQP